VLELGGNAPLIVMEDADLEKAATLAVQGATKNSGQRCTAVKRVLCVEAVADDFIPLVVEKAKAIRYGDPMDRETDMGTVIHEQAAGLFERRVLAAVEAGAELLYGNDRQGALYSPTVLDKVPYDCELVREETFGPPIPVIRVRDIDEAIAVANSTAFGLSSGVCTSNWDYIQRFIAELRTGTVNVWEVPGYRTEMSPFGGIKDSGLGYKEGVLEAMKISVRREAWQERNLGAANRAICERDAEAFVHQSVSSPCLTAVKRAEGIWVEDFDGRRYMDFHGNSVHHIGYRATALRQRGRAGACRDAGRPRAGRSGQGALHHRWLRCGRGGAEDRPHGHRAL
jgi:delta 1-pyrroline-5-carboxylate dehydrogenase